MENRYHLRNRDVILSEQTSPASSARPSSAVAPSRFSKKVSSSDTPRRSTRKAARTKLYNATTPSAAGRRRKLRASEGPDAELTEADVVTQNPSRRALRSSTGDPVVEKGNLGNSGEDGHEKGSSRLASQRTLVHSTNTPRRASRRKTPARGRRKLPVTQASGVTKGTNSLIRSSGDMARASASAVPKSTLSVGDADKSRNKIQSNTSSRPVSAQAVVSTGLHTCSNPVQETELLPTTSELNCGKEPELDENVQSTTRIRRGTSRTRTPEVDDNSESTGSRLRSSRRKRQQQVSGGGHSSASGFKTSGVQRKLKESSADGSQLPFDTVHSDRKTYGLGSPPLPPLPEATAKPENNTDRLENIAVWKKPDLVEECKHRGLRIGGTKGELISRIVSDVDKVQTMRTEPNLAHLQSQVGIKLRAGEGKPVVAGGDEGSRKTAIGTGVKALDTPGTCGVIQTTGETIVEDGPNGMTDYTADTIAEHSPELVTFASKPLCRGDTFSNLQNAQEHATLLLPFPPETSRNVEDQQKHVHTREKTRSISSPLMVCTNVSLPNSTREMGSASNKLESDATTIAVVKPGSGTTKTAEDFAPSSQNNDNLGLRSVNDGLKSTESPENVGGRGPGDQSIEKTAEHIPNMSLECLVSPPARGTSVVENGVRTSENLHIVDRMSILKTEKVARTNSDDDFGNTGERKAGEETPGKLCGADENLGRSKLTPQDLSMPELKAVFADDIERTPSDSMMHGNVIPSRDDLQNREGFCDVQEVAEGVRRSAPHDSAEKEDLLIANTSKVLPARAIDRDGGPKARGADKVCKALQLRQGGLDDTVFLEKHSPMTSRKAQTTARDETAIPSAHHSTDQKQMGDPTWKHDANISSLASGVASPDEQTAQVNRTVNSEKANCEGQGEQTWHGAGLKLNVISGRSEERVRATEEKIAMYTHGPKEKDDVAATHRVTAHYLSAEGVESDSFSLPKTESPLEEATQITVDRSDVHETKQKQTLISGLGQHVYLEELPGDNPAAFSESPLPSPRPPDEAQGRGEDKAEVTAGDVFKSDASASHDPRNMSEVIPSRDLAVVSDGPVGEVDVDMTQRSDPLETKNSLVDIQDDVEKSDSDTPFSESPLPNPVFDEDAISPRKEPERGTGDIYPVSEERLDHNCKDNDCYKRPSCLPELDVTSGKNVVGVCDDEIPAGRRPLARNEPMGAVLDNEKDDSEEDQRQQQRHLEAVDIACSRSRLDGATRGNVSGGTQSLRSSEQNQSYDDSEGVSSSEELSYESGQSGSEVREERVHEDQANIASAVNGSPDLSGDVVMISSDNGSSSSPGQGDQYESPLPLQDAKEAGGITKLSPVGTNNEDRCQGEYSEPLPEVRRTERLVNNMDLRTDLPLNRTVSSNEHADLLPVNVVECEGANGPSSGAARCEIACKEGVVKAANETNSQEPHEKGDSPVDFTSSLHCINPSDVLLRKQTVDDATSARKAVLPEKDSGLVLRASSQISGPQTTRNSRGAPSVSPNEFVNGGIRSRGPSALASRNLRNGEGSKEGTEGYSLKRKRDDTAQIRASDEDSEANLFASGTVAKRQKTVPLLLPIIKIQGPSAAMAEAPPIPGQDSSFHRDNGGGFRLPFGTRRTDASSSILEKLSRIEDVQIGRHRSTFGNGLKETKGSTLGCAVIKESGVDVFRTGSAADRRIVSQPVVRKKAVLRVLHSRKAWNSDLLAAQSLRRAHELAKKVGAWTSLQSPFDSDK